MTNRLIVGAMVLMIALTSLGLAAGISKPPGDVTNPINKCTPCYSI